MSIEPAPGLVVAGRFRLSRLIGRGGMGSVWLADHLGLDVPCAVKFIEGEVAHHAEVKMRFEREAKAAAQLRSPHVVQMLDYGVWEDTPYIAMELLDGEDLAKRLARVRRLPPRDVLMIVGQVCRALSKAHALGIVHRDLKPDNIFLVRDDDREIVKVLDFGIAKAIGSVAAGAPGAGTRTGAVLGTPYYMSPEQAQGTKAVDARSDLWSLGIIVFEAMTGHRPFESEALGDLLVKIIVGPIPLPSQAWQDVPRGFDAWWIKASQRDAAQRHPNARELSESLAIALDPPTADSRVLSSGQAFAAPAGESVDARVFRPGIDQATAAPISRTFGARPPDRKRWIAAALGVFMLAAGAILAAAVGFRQRTDAAAHPAARALVVGAPETAAAAPAPSAARGATVTTVEAPAAALASASAPPPSGDAGGAPTGVKTARAAAQVWTHPPVAIPERSAQPAPSKSAESRKKEIDLGI